MRYKWVKRGLQYDWDFENDAGDFVAWVREWPSGVFNPRLLSSHIPHDVTFSTLEEAQRYAETMYHLSK